MSILSVSLSFCPSVKTVNAEKTADSVEIRDTVCGGGSGRPNEPCIK